MREKRRIEEGITVEDSVEKKVAEDSVEKSAPRRDHGEKQMLII